MSLKHKREQEARALLELIAAALRTRGHRVETNPEDLVKPQRAWTIRVDGINVPLVFDLAPSHVRLSCLWLWVRGKSDLARKTFVHVPKRAATYGYNLAAVADHVGLWVRTHVAVTAKAQAEEEFERQWATVADEMKARFPEVAHLVKSDARGIQLQLILGARQAEAVLRALRDSREVGAPPRLDPAVAAELDRLERGS